MNERSRPKRGSTSRLPGATGEQILLLLCSGRRTVADLAGKLRLTDNAVRAQLDRLQRQGLARPAGARPGVRRPHVEYELAPPAQDLFPKAYEPALHRLLDVLTERLPAEARNELLREATRRILAQRFQGVRGRGLQQRLASAMSALNGSALGVVVAQEVDKTIVSACSCPLATITAAHPDICALVASVVGPFLQADVRERCERGPSPRCRFEIRLLPPDART